MSITAMTAQQIAAGVYVASPPTNEDENDLLMQVNTYHRVHSDLGCLKLEALGNGCRQRGYQEISGHKLNTSSELRILLRVYTSRSESCSDLSTVVLLKQISGARESR